MTGLFKLLLLVLLNGTLVCGSKDSLRRSFEALDEPTVCQNLVDALVMKNVDECLELAKVAEANMVRFAPDKACEVWKCWEESADNSSDDDAEVLFPFTSPSYHPYTEMTCPQEDSFVLFDDYVAWGELARAWFTAPSEFIAIITHPLHGQVALTKTFLPPFTWLGEFHGAVTGEPKMRHDRILPIRRQGMISHWLDATDLRTANWLRYVNPSTRHVNVRTVQCHGTIFFLTTKSVLPGQILWRQKE